MCASTCIVQYNFVHTQLICAEQQLAKKYYLRKSILEVNHNKRFFEQGRLKTDAVASLLKKYFKKLL